MPTLSGNRLLLFTVVILGLACWFLAMHASLPVLSAPNGSQIPS
jgi:hypothetical protein